MLCSCTGLEFVSVLMFCSAAVVVCVYSNSDLYRSVQRFGRYFNEHIYLTFVCDTLVNFC